MKKNFLRLALTLAFISFLHFSCSSPANALLSTLGGNPQLSGISSLLKGAGGLGNLVGKGPFTLLAPSNNALSSLGAGAMENLLKPENKEMLTGILKKHILPGKYTADQINAGGLKDVLGNPLNMGGAKITESIPTKGGLVQVIDGIIK
jgi:uncharacterized surface protein with fasciclin (FAS1) repeats